MIFERYWGAMKLSISRLVAQRQLTLADHLEQQARLQWIEGQVTDLVDDQQFRLHQRVDLAMQPVLVHGLGQPVGQIDGGGEVDAMAHLAGRYAQRDLQMRLPHARRPEQPDVASFFEEAASRQFLNDAAIDLRLQGEVEVLQLFDVGGTW